MIRRKFEVNRKLSVLKKTNFLQYVNEYSLNSQLSTANSEELHKNVPPELPAINKPTMFPCIEDESEFNLQSFTEKFNDFKSTSKTIDDSKPPRHGVRESFRQKKIVQLLNVNQMIAKSVTPSTRGSKKTSIRVRQQKKNKTLDVSARTEAFLSPSKNLSTIQTQRTYIGQICYMKKKVSSPPQLEFSKTRRQKSEICPWDAQIQSQPQTF